MKTRLVLDAWAILALLQGEEPAATRIQEVLEQGAKGDVEVSISIINLGEVVYRVGKVKGEEQAWETLEQLKRLSLAILPASEEAVFAAARFKMRSPISYADAFAAAAAAASDAVLLTGDRELLQLQGCIRLEPLSRLNKPSPKKS